MPSSQNVEEVKLDLDRDRFLRNLLRVLTGTLENVVGLDEAEGYVSVVGNEIGCTIDSAYRNAINVERLNQDEVARVLVDLKKRIEGDFYIIEESEERLVFGNRRCPFGEYVKGRTSLCMMTSNVFGRIAADNLGYARVELDETIAKGDAGCRIVVNLKPTDGNTENSREYYREYRESD